MCNQYAIVCHVSQKVYYHFVDYILISHYEKRAPKFIAALDVLPSEMGPVGIEPTTKRL